MSWFTKNTLIGRIETIIRISLMSLGLGVVAYGLVEFLDIPNHFNPSPQVRVLAMMTDELEHRAKVCNDAIDVMSPDMANATTFHCAMMWLEFQKVRTFLASQKMVPSTNTKAVLIEATRTAFRYGEYSRMLNSPSIPHGPSVDPKSEF